MPVNALKLQNASVATRESRVDITAALRSASPSEASFFIEKLANLVETSAKNEKIGDSSRQRLFGVYYTSFELARAIVQEAIRLNGSAEGTFLEPCVGGGAFLVAFIDLNLKDKDVTQDLIKSVLERCYIADNDAKAIENLQEALPLYLKAMYGYEAFLPEGNILLGDSLFDSGEGKWAIRDLPAYFGVDGGFDFVITNPPYLLIKNDQRRGEKSNEQTTSLSEKLKQSKSFEYVKGQANLYKLFTEAILSKWVKTGGTAGLLIPRSLLTDTQSEKLRTFLLSNFQLGPILNLQEGNKHFKNVGQSFSAFAAKKGAPTIQVAFSNASFDSPGFSQDSEFEIRELKRIIPNGALFNISKPDFEKLGSLSYLPKVSDSRSIVNLRGEFDMTLDRNFLTEEDTGLRLLQGSNLEYFGFTSSDKFVSREFLNRPKGKWINTFRIACQQITNMNSNRRLKWALIPPNYVLGNSCNFISIDPEYASGLPQENLEFILGVLNSDLVNWRFKILSSNNHVSNLEISTFPIGKPTHEDAAKIAMIARRLCDSMVSEDLELLNEVVNTYFDKNSRG